MIRVYCGDCGSTDVYRKRIAYWCEKSSRWLDEPYSDEFYCDQCSGSNIKEKDVRDDT
jgi:predicted nucleic-acid-binding Zn-ribbon protein